MAKKNPKQVQTLANGQEVKTTSTGWNPKDVGGLYVLTEGWKEGTNPHHSVAPGLFLAAKEKIEGLYLGDFEAEDEKGKEVLVPTFDATVMNDEMQLALVEKYDLEVPVLRMAASRTVKKELDATNKALYDNVEVMKILESTNPELYKKLNDAFGTEKVDEVPVEEE